MSQKSRQTATSNVEKDFYKLLNNSNFGIDCRNNIDNCFLEPIHDDFQRLLISKITAQFSAMIRLENFFRPHY